MGMRANAKKLETCNERFPATATGQGARGNVLRCGTRPLPRQSGAMLQRRHHRWCGLPTTLRNRRRWPRAATSTRDTSGALHETRALRAFVEHVVTKNINGPALTHRHATRTACPSRPPVRLDVCRERVRGRSEGRPSALELRAKVGRFGAKAGGTWPMSTQNWPKPAQIWWIPSQI